MHRESLPVSKSRQIRWFYTAAALILLVSVFSYFITTWNGVKRQVEAELSHVDGLFSQSIESVFRHHETVLMILGQRLLDIDAGNFPERGRGLIDDLMKVNPAMAGFGLAEPNGQLLLVSGIEPGRPLPNLLLRSESTATFLQVFDTSKLVIGRTYYFTLVEKWLIPIRIAVQNELGFIRLVMTAGLDIDAEDAIWNALELPEGMRITLLRSDGFTQLRLPTDISNREAVFDEPVPDPWFLVQHAPLSADPFFPDSVAVSSQLLDGSMRTFVSYPRSHLIDLYLDQMIIPGILFSVAILAILVLFYSAQENQRRYDEQLLYQAHHDALTRLPNRLLVLDRLGVDLARAHRTGRRVAVFYIDLDRFKRVNDNYGHSTGDALLLAATSRITETLREGDTVGRLGGDEFLVVLPDLRGREEAEILALRVLRSFSKPFQMHDFEVHGTASIGISVSPNDGDDPDTLLQNADAALYKAKNEGRNGYFFYQRDLNEQAFRRSRIDRELRLAMERDELELVYQPQVAAATREWVGLEAMLRWRSAELGSVLPSEFIPVAEETGLIIQVGEYALSAAIRDVKKLNGRRGSQLRVAVNTSTFQLRQQGFLDWLTALLKEQDFPPELLELEVTESVLADGAEQFQGLSDAGIRLAIDDFGTGFSSLGYLKQMPVSTIKIDRSFINDLEVDQADRALTTAIIVMAKELNIETIAEGVETEWQLAFLEREGCSMAQGYLLARPMSIGKLLDVF